ncbi:MAG: tetratricopeptide repeat protein [Acidobacteriota bacterium]|nr:tetratricopeptide repeat protein [Acidobacteriota bacterium]
MKARWIGSLAALAAVVLGSAGCAQLKARDALNRGSAAFKANQFSQAVEYFKTAVQIDPNLEAARLYLATAYMAQYIPGAESKENIQNANAALEQFNKVLEKNPKEETATADIASIYYNQKNWDKAEEWNKKLIALNPKAKDAYYVLGVIAWYRWLPPDREARVKEGMKPDDPGPLKDAKVREDLKVKYLPILDDGIKAEQRALEIDPEYENAMAYMNLLIRYRADLMNSREEWKKQSEIADDWVQKSMAAIKTKADKKASAANTGAK